MVTGTAFPAHGVTCVCVCATGERSTLNRTHRVQSATVPRECPRAEVFSALARRLTRAARSLTGRSKLVPPQMGLHLPRPLRFTAVGLLLARRQAPMALFNPAIVPVVHAAVGGALHHKGITDSAGGGGRFLRRSGGAGQRRQPGDPRQDGVLLRRERRAEPGRVAFRSYSCGLFEARRWRRRSGSA